MGRTIAQDASKSNIVPLLGFFGSFWRSFRISDLMLVILFPNVLSYLHILRSFSVHPFHWCWLGFGYVWCCWSQKVGWFANMIIFPHLEHLNTYLPPASKQFSEQRTSQMSSVLLSTRLLISVIFEMQILSTLTLVNTIWPNYEINYPFQAHLEHEKLCTSAYESIPLGPLREMFLITARFPCICIFKDIHGVPYTSLQKINGKLLAYFSHHVCAERPVFRVIISEDCIVLVTNVHQRLDMDR